MRAGKISAHLGDPARRHGGRPRQVSLGDRASDSFHWHDRLCFCVGLQLDWLPADCDGIPGNRRDLSGPTSDVNLPSPRALCHRVVHIESLRERHLGATSSITVSAGW